MKSLQPRRSLQDRCLPNSSRTSRMTPFPRKHKRREGTPRKRSPMKPLQNPRLLLHKNLTRRMLGLHYHPHTRQHPSRRRSIGIPTLPSCGSLQSKGIRIRCIPAPALFITHSRIIRPEHIPHQCQVTRHLCMGIISPRTLSRRTKCMNRRRMNLLRRRRL